MAAAANVVHSTDREKSDRLDRRQGEEADKEAAARTLFDPNAAAGGGTTETESVDRDALHQADYGGSREPAGIPGAASSEETQQGGSSSDEAAGGGKEPTGDRDSDYDPDGDRSGL